MSNCMHFKLSIAEMTFAAYVNYVFGFVEEARRTYSDCSLL